MAIIRERYQIPDIDEVLQELNGSVIFRKIDLNMGFHS